MTAGALPIALQWTLKSMQLVNWGCFDGYHPVPFAGPRQVTLITGSTGTGKSTLLDAHIVLTHDTSTALNRASNSTGHRSRSGETRNVVSYMRGVHGQTRDIDGEHDLLLREGAVWSAIAETWRSSAGGTLTALSMFFSNPNDTNRPHLRRDAWIPADFDLRWLEQFATGSHVEAPFPPRTMEKAYPGLQVETSTRALHRTLWKQLGIGAEGDGKMAMDLLYKVQAADAVESVNDLFIRFVLDKPCTYPAAEEAEKHFAKLRESRERVRVIEDQTSRLARIPRLWQDYQTGRDEAAFLTQMAPCVEPAHTPFWKWRRDRECEALEEAELATTREYKQAEADHQAATRDAERLAEQWSDLAAAIGQHTGLAQLPTLEAELRAAEETVDRIQQTREKLETALGDTVAVPLLRPAYDRQRTASTAFLDTYPNQAGAIEKRIEDAQREQWRLSNQIKQLRQDRDHYQGRHDVVDKDHDWIRNRYAALLGLPATELPYAGELIDMLPEFEPWRMAAEKVLGGTATSLLVPESHLASFRRVANAELTIYRLPYLTVRTAATVGHADPETIAGRLQFRDHPYSSWLSERLRRTARHLCVNSPDDLGDLPAGHIDAVTIAGQTASRSGGMVGGQRNHRHTIGFSPEAILDNIDADIEQLTNQLQPADQAFAEARRHQETLNSRRHAHDRFLETDWASIDLPGATDALNTLTHRREALTADPTATTLLAQQATLRKQLKQANSDVDTREQHANELNQRRRELMERKDAAWNHLTSMDAIPDPNGERLDELLAAHRGDDESEATAPTAADFQDKAWRKFVRYLHSKNEEAGRAGATARGYLAQTFEDYLREYADNPGAEDLTTDPDRSYWQFIAIYDRHLASGVEGAKADFTQYAIEYGGHELTSLAMAYQTERDLIESRLGEIRSALADQPFGETPTGRVSIEVRDGHAPTEVAAFRAALTAATSGATRLLTYDEAVTKFNIFDQLITQMSNPSTRDTLLDVRRHIAFEAQHLDNGELVSFHRDLGTKSGGESQELTMFIIAAAIRYKVGSLDATTPRFAPVFMDEGLIKADPARTRKAVDVWTRLGFQPIIASTTDKHESISRTASLFLAVSKDPTHRSRIDTSIEEPTQHGPARP